MSQVAGQGLTLESLLRAMEAAGWGDNPSDGTIEMSVKKGAAGRT